MSNWNSRTKNCLVKSLLSRSAIKQIKWLDFTTSLPSLTTCPKRMKQRLLVPKNYKRNSSNSLSNSARCRQRYPFYMLDDISRPSSTRIYPRMPRPHIIYWKVSSMKRLKACLRLLRSSMSWKTSRTSFTTSSNLPKFLNFIWIYTIT